jgi:DNA invertase Pin-like site-specific DNA recombinase
MANGRKYVAYYRVSTGKQQRSGLGLEAQQEAVRQLLYGGDWNLLGEFTEKEKGNRNSGKRSDRPALAQALALCRIHNATLVVAKLDRLARNTQFLLTVVKESGEAGVIFCDLPTIPEGPVGKFIVTQMASVAELEAGLCSQRTKAALQAAKARGKVLGCRNTNIRRYATVGAKASASVRSANATKRANDILPIINSIKAEAVVSLRRIAAVLTERSIPAPRGGQWSAVQVQRVLKAA